jgi:hypothetical protein
VEVENYEYEGDYEGAVTVDKRVPQLLPVTLQHLTLSEGGDLGLKVVLLPNSLTRLTGLQQLTLEGVEMDSKGCQAAAKRLRALQQVRVRGPRWGVPRDDPMLLLGPKLVEHTLRHSLTAAAAAQLVHLTRLVWDWGGGPSAEAAEALGSLTGLHELSLDGNMGSAPAAAVVLQAAGLPQLRSLQLKGGAESQGEVSAALAQCTQLTSLFLELSKDWGKPYLPVPQQLTGLQRLTVPWDLMRQEADAWLAPLTALTRLCCDTTVGGLLLPGEWPGLFATHPRQQLGPLHRAKAQEVLQQVQVWPPALQQVVVWMDQRLAVQGIAPRHWQHTPSALGSAPFTVYFEEGNRSGSGQAAQGWARPFSPCPHLPGVRELSNEVQGD